MDSVVRYLEEVDPPAAARARERYDCFDRWGDDPTDYAYAGLGSETCEQAVIEQLIDLQQTLEKELPRSAEVSDDAFFARQNALVVKNAEEYYRSMYVPETFPTGV